MNAIKICLFIIVMLIAFGGCQLVTPSANQSTLAPLDSTPTAVAAPLDSTPTAVAAQQFLRRVAAWGAGVPEALVLSPDGAALYLATSQFV
ncbi:MAG: hypothetical protein ACUVS4_15690 [Chloroflexaceae bacterium]